MFAELIYSNDDIGNYIRDKFVALDLISQLNNRVIFFGYNSWGNNVHLNKLLQDNWLDMKEIPNDIIYISSSLVFDGLRFSFSETDIPKPVTVFGFSKFVGEQELKESDTIVRTGLIFGYKNGWVSKILREVRNGSSVYIPSIYISIIHIDSLYRFLVELCEIKTLPKIINIAASDIVFLPSFMQTLAKKVGINTNLIRAIVPNIHTDQEFSQNSGLKPFLAESLGFTVPSIESQIDQFVLR